MVPPLDSAPLDSALDLAPGLAFALEAALGVAFPKLSIRVVDFPRPGSEPPAGELRGPAQLGVRNVTLGRDARLGSEPVRPARALLKLSAGPVGRLAGDALLPGRADHTRLRAIVESVTGGSLDAEIQLALGEEPRARLGARFGARLGATQLARPRATRAEQLRIPLTGDARGAARGRPAPPG